MRKFSKIICLVMLCCFAWTASAGTFCCYKTDSASSQPSVDASVEKIDQVLMGMNCHCKSNIDQERPSTKIFPKDDCKDMSSCGVANLATAPNSLVSIDITHQSGQPTLIDQFFSNSATPPTPPPKQS